MVDGGLCRRVYRCMHVHVFERVRDNSWTTTFTYGAYLDVKFECGEWGMVRWRSRVVAWFNEVQSTSMHASLCDGSVAEALSCMLEYSTLSDLAATPRVPLSSSSWGRCQGVVLFSLMLVGHRDFRPPLSVLKPNSLYHVCGSDRCFH